ncbi:MAG: hypothetical protein D6782_02575, partial [Alphaproteobacteria bacterium]
MGYRHGIAAFVNGFAAFIIGVLLGWGAPGAMAGAPSDSLQGRVIGAANLARCNWSNEDKRQYLQATQRLAQDHESAEIRLETTQEKQQREERDAQRLLNASPAELEQIQLEYAQYAQHGIPTLVCSGEGENATWVSVIARRTADDTEFHRRNIKEAQRRSRGDGNGDVFSAGPDATPRGNPDICARNPQSYTCKYGHAEQQPPPKRRIATPQPQPQPQPQPNPLQKPDEDCQPELDAASQAQLRNKGMGLIDTMVAMGAQTDHMLNAMGEAITAQLAYLSQPNAKIWDDRKTQLVKTGQAIVDYMTNDNASNHENLRAAAERSVKSILADPSGALGKAAAGVLMGRFAGGTQGFCIAGAARAKAALRSAFKAEKAADRMEHLLTEKARLKNGVG